ncbi:MAG: 50S ribosomal protein L25 [Patescibacteria group bacterium]|nr:50S ribosomal protein L25 [Patescibacteria group bacterium]
MASQELKATLREKVGKKSESLRKEGLIPAVLYGHGLDNKNLSVNRKEFSKVFEKSGYSHLLDLNIEKAKPIKVLVHDIQLDPVSDSIIHVDFYQIREDEKITTEIPLVFVHEAPAVKELGAILVTNYHNIKIKCLPAELEKIGSVEVDLSSLKNFSDSIHIRDLKLPKEVEVLESATEIIVIATEPKEEVVEEAPKAATEVKTVAEEEAAKKAAEAGEAGAVAGAALKEAGAAAATKPVKEKAK